MLDEAAPDFVVEGAFGQAEVFGELAAGALFFLGEAEVAVVGGLDDFARRTAWLRTFIDMSASALYFSSIKEGRVPAKVSVCMKMPMKVFSVARKSGILGLFSSVAMVLCLGAGTTWGACGGDGEVAGEWIFEPEEGVPGWAVNSGGDGDMGNLGLTGGAAFSTNVPPVNCDCGHSLGLAGTNGAAGAVSVASYDPLAGAEKFSVMAWVRRESAAGENLSARIFSDADSTAPTNTTAGVEFRFSGSAGNLALRINGTEVATTVGGVAPESGEWHHVAAVYDGTRAATNYATRNVHFYVDGVQKGVGSVLQGVVVASNDAPVVVGNASAARTAGNLLVGNVDDVLVIPGWAPESAGNGNASEAIQCFMAWADDIFPPGIAAPGDVEAEAGECLEPVAVELGSPAAWDDCGVAGVANDAPEAFGVGETTVTWTATDVAGNTASAVQTVTVFPSATGDCDGDGLTDWEEEMELGTDATLWDTDGDGWGDGEEAAAGFDPLDAGDVPKVLLNAVMYNPSGTDTGREWVELQSASVRDVDLGGFRLEVGRDGVWTLAAELAAETVLEPGQCLLIGESAVSNADVTAVLAIPNAWTNEATTGVRLRRGGAAGRVADAVFIGGSAEFNAAGLDATGWTDTNSVWAHAGCVLERRFPGVDNDRSCDWHEVAGHDGRDTSAESDFDGDGLSDGDEWSGRLNPWGEPTTPWRADSDGDGLGDYAECVTHGTNPNAWASDGDIYPRPPPSGSVTDWWGSDPYEIAHGWNPLVADENANGVPDSWEMAFPGAGLSADADADGFSNLDELLQNSDPLDGDSSTAEPYVLRFESSLPGEWANDGLTDVGLEGWVKITFEGLKTNMDLCVRVLEGQAEEEFKVVWENATHLGNYWFNDNREVVTCARAEANTQPCLLVEDRGLHPQYTNTLGGEYAIDACSLRLALMWETPNKANQIFNPTPKDDKSDEGYQEWDEDNKAMYGIHREKLYLVSNEQNEYSVSLDLDIWPVSKRGQFIAAAYKDGEKISGSDTAVSSQNGVSVDMTFADPSIAAAETDFPIKVALDVNNNGHIDGGEPLFGLEVYKHPVDHQSRCATVFGINNAKYLWHQRKIAFYLNLQLSDAPPAEPDEPDGIAMHARSLLYLFMTGDENDINSDMRPTSTDEAQIDSLPQTSANSNCFSEWLTHNSGAPFNDQGFSMIPLRIWDENTPLSEFLAFRSPFALETARILPGSYLEIQTDTGKLLEQFYDNQVRGEVEALLQDEPIGATMTMPPDGGFYHFPNQYCNLFRSDSPAWVPSNTVLVGTANAYGGLWGAFLLQYLGGTDSFDEIDAAGTIGRGRLIDPKYQFTVQKVQHGMLMFGEIAYEVIAVKFICTIEDLYDFNYEDSELASHAAAHQIGFGNGNNGRSHGMIYRHRIHIQQEYAHPFEQQTVVYPILP